MCFALMKGRWGGLVADGQDTSVSFNSMNKGIRTTLPTEALRASGKL